MSSGSRRRSGQAVALLLLGVLAGLVLSACSSSDDDEAADTDSTSSVAEDGEETTADESSSTSVVATGEGGSGPETGSEAGEEAEASGLESSDAPVMMLIQFAQAWEDGNWKSMAAVADEPVVTTATDWFADGGEVSVVGADGDDLAAGCEPQDDGAAWVCELLYGPPSETAGIFDLTLGATPGGVRITALEFAGDAG